MALAAEELRRAGFRCYVCPITQRRRLYVAPGTVTPGIQLMDVDVAIVRVRAGWFVGKPFGEEKLANPKDHRLFTIQRRAMPLAALQGPFQNWRAAMACYRITAGVQ